MTDQRSLIIPAVIGLMFSIAAPAWAADLSFYVGGVKPGSIEFQNVKRPLDGSPIFGFRLGTEFVPSFGMEHTLAFSSDYLFPKGIGSVRDAKGFLYNANLLLSLSSKKAVPYVTFGAGVLHQYGSSDLPVGTKFAFNYGGGLKFPRLAGRLGLRFDIRGYSAGIVSKNINLLEMSGGIMISTGR